MSSYLLFLIVNNKLLGARGKIIVDLTHFLVVERSYNIIIYLFNKL